MARQAGASRRPRQRTALPDRLDWPSPPATVCIETTPPANRVARSPGLTITAGDHLHRDDPASEAAWLARDPSHLSCQTASDHRCINPCQLAGASTRVGPQRGFIVGFEVLVDGLWLGLQIVL